MKNNELISVGGYLAKRLERVGIKHYFGVPGDYNLILLDELLKNKNLQFIGCCNELNAGYAADGYSRANGIAALVVTFSVGGLSALNAVAGAYSEDHPIVVISGGPNTNSEPENQLLHHTLGEIRYSYQRDIYSEVTKEAVIIKHIADAPYQIDTAIQTSLEKQKPVYIEIPCNIAGLQIHEPQLFKFTKNTKSNPEALSEAVESTATILNSAPKPILVAGVKLRPWEALDSFKTLAEKSGYAVATMPNAKGYFPEDHPNYIGTYWGPVSSPGTAEIVESANAYLFAGPTFTDYTTTGYSSLINHSKLIHVGPDYVKLPNKTYNNVFINEFLKELSNVISYNDASLVAYNRIRPDYSKTNKLNSNEILTTKKLFKMVQDILDSNSAVIAETGDSWFNGMNLVLPNDCKFEIQMQYGSIGWSVGATLGYQLATTPQRRIISLIGDGSFQLTAQEMSTMIRYNLNPIIFLINNGGYTIEVEIHDGPYNNIQNWNYADLVNVFNGDSGNGISFKVNTEGELQKAINKSLKHNGLSLIEVIIDRDDCSKELLEWGTRVASNNSRPPKITEL
ncbi:MAG: thiamine pyrophosphate-binding protein [Thermodesulfobacteriota bacterium]